MIPTLDRLKGIERITYERKGVGADERSATLCPHGGAFWKNIALGHMHDCGERVPAFVGTNGCWHCIFHEGTEINHVRCLFLLASQKKTDKLIRAALRDSP